MGVDQSCQHSVVKEESLNQGDQKLSRHFTGASMGENDSSNIDEIGFLGRQHHRLRFTELSETFFGRLILLKCPDGACRDLVQVQLSLADLYRQTDLASLEERLKDVTFEVSTKITELMVDGLNTVFGSSLVPHADSLSAFDYFSRHIESRLEWLQRGDESSGLLPCIESYTRLDAGLLPVFNIWLRPAVLVERLASAIRSILELKAELMRKLLLMGEVSGELPLRIDYRKQVDTLLKCLEDRRQNTGETEFCILSNQIPFRWGLSYTVAGFTMPTPGTTTAEDKVMLPFLLEINGLLDICTIDLDSDPTDPNNVVVRYFVSRPASRNLFGATGQGLIPSHRSQLSETELCVYGRIHRSLCTNLMFGGRPNFEMSFGALCSWLIRKAAFCLEEPTFMRDRAATWLAEHANKGRINMEDGFFLPQIYERLREKFGAQVVKKPERFAGEIDILFNNEIPIELKVRRGACGPLLANELDETFRPGSQAAAYAAISRLAFVLVLDLPEGNSMVANLESCASVIVKEISPNAEFPTCIVVVIFHCHHPTPSSLK